MERINAAKDLLLKFLSSLRNPTTVLTITLAVTVLVFV